MTRNERKPPRGAAKEGVENELIVGGDVEWGLKQHAAGTC